MKLSTIIICAILGVIAGIAAFSGLSGPAWADNVTVNLTDDSSLSENPADWNYGSEDYIRIHNVYEQERRIVCKIPSQLGGGNVTSVLLYYFYAWYNDDDPVGEQIWACKLTQSYIESEVTWQQRYSGAYWTNYGGTYTTVNKVVEVYPASTWTWVYWNITAMCNATWPSDLYVVIKFPWTGTDDDPKCTTAFASAEHSTYKPHLIVTYADEVQEPDLALTVNEVGDDWISVYVTPTLYDAGWGNITAQAAINGTGNYVYNSTSVNVTSNDPVLLTITGLTKEQNYDLRAKMVWSGGTVYSNVVQQATRDYIVPSFSIDESGVGLYEATLYAKWADNTDAKNVTARIKYKPTYEGLWAYTSWQSSTAVNGSLSWYVSGLGEAEYDYQAEYVIDGDNYTSAASILYLGQWPDFDIVIDDHGIDYVNFSVPYDCNDSDYLYMYMGIKQSGTYDWTYSAAQNVTGTGTAYFSFDTLQQGVKYYYYLHTVDSEGGVIDSSGSDYFWTEAIVEEPSINSVWASVVEPNTLRLYADIAVADAAPYGKTLYFMWHDEVIAEKLISGWQATDSANVTVDGDYYVEATIGDVFQWDDSYSYYAVFDYTVGTVESAISWFDTGDMPFYVETLDAIDVTESSAMLRGFVQLAGLPMSEYRFRWWVSGGNAYQYTQYVEITESGVYNWTLTNLSYGESYSFQFFISYNQEYGAVKTFRCGYGTTPPGGTPDTGFDLPFIGDISNLWDFFAHSAAGHWLLMILAMGIVALIFYRKHRGVALIMCFLILGLGIIIRWIDPWVVVLLAIGGGIWLWRVIVAQRGQA